MDNDIVKNKSNLFGREILPSHLFDIYKNFKIDLFRDEEKSLPKEGINENTFYVSPYDEVKSLCQKLHLIKVEAIRYREQNEISKAIQHFYRTCHKLTYGNFRHDQRPIHILYILEKKSGIINLYLGCILEQTAGDREDVIKTFDSILPGILPGCTITPIEGPNEKEKTKEHSDLEMILSGYINYDHRCVLYGIPTLTKKKTQRNDYTEKNDDSVSSYEWGIERVLDAVNKDFSIVCYSKPVEGVKVEETRAIFNNAIDFFHRVSKLTVQHSENESITKGNHTSKNTGTTEGITYGDNITSSLLKMFKRWYKGGEMSTVNNTTTSGQNEGTSTQKTRGNSDSYTEERINSLAQATEQQLKLYDKRFEKGISNGMWEHSIQVVSENAQVASHVSKLLASYLMGDEQPISKINIIETEPDHCSEKNNKLPLFELCNCDKIRNLFADNPFGEYFSGISTLLTHEEMSIVAGIPNYEVPGLYVEKLTDYARNYPRINSSNANEKSVSIGKLIDREIKTDKDIFIDFAQLQRHAFVTGATGAGKSTTMSSLLLNLNKKGIPFLVIEPVKQEYRELGKLIPNLQVITLGDIHCDVSLNPFEVQDGIGLIPHIDNLKAAFNASMGNYSSMPFILEDVLYRAYQKVGWDLVTGKNDVIEKLKRTKIPNHSTPLMEDLLPLVSESIKIFFEDRQSDYGNSLFGALKARIGSMTRGAKGKVLNSFVNSISMEEMLTRPCVIELWPFADNEEKAFVMALILIKLYEFRQAQDLKRLDSNEKLLDHVLVIEEAHRLLAKQQQASEYSISGKQKAVEFFADMLAEIRSYGQGIIVVDQIPSKLIPDVLKNTDVKIAHRLADKEDREIVGATMNLTSDQMKDLARLAPGEAVVYYGGLRQSLKIKVERKYVR